MTDDMNNAHFNNDRPTFVFSTSQEKMHRNSQLLLEKDIVILMESMVEFGE